MRHQGDFLYTFCPNLLDGGIHKDRAFAKQSLLRWPCPLTDFAWVRPATNRNHSRQEAHKYQAPVAPQTPDLSNRDVCSYDTESNALPTELLIALFLAYLFFLYNHCVWRGGGLGIVDRTG